MLYPTHLRKKFCVLSMTLASGLVFADADISVQLPGNAAEATANVDIRVVVPEILIFGVGDVGNTVALLEWTAGSSQLPVVPAGSNNVTYTGAAAPFAAPAPFATVPTVAISNDGGTGSVATNVATLPVFLFSNNGTAVTITTDSVGGGSDELDDGAGNTIPISDFTGGQVGSILHPPLETGMSADTAATAGIVNLAGSWTYTYTPTVSPTAGSYNARITYIASQP